MNNSEIVDFIATNYSFLSSIEYYNYTTDELNSDFLIAINISKPVETTNRFTGNKEITRYDYTGDRFNTAFITLNDIESIGSILDNLKNQKLIGFKKTLMLEQLKSFLCQLHTHKHNVLYGVTND